MMCFTVGLSGFLTETFLNTFSGRELSIPLYHSTFLVEYSFIVLTEMSQPSKMFPKNWDCPYLNNPPAKLVAGIIKPQVLHISFRSDTDKIGGQPHMVTQTYDPIT